jgi:hypothetical protein
MEVVVLSITNSNQEHNSMNDSCHKHQHPFFNMRIEGKHTCSRGILSEVTSLVSAEESLWLNCWCCTSRELLVEADYALHAGCILSGTDSLFPIRCILPACCCSGDFAGLWRGSIGCAIGKAIATVLELTVGEATYD